MSKRAERPQSRRHIFVYDEDWEFLTSHFGPSSDNKRGVGWAIRQIIHQKVKSIREREIAEREASAPVGQSVGENERGEA